MGYDFLMAGGGIPDAVTLACLEHHERMDGAGYPQALPGAQISLLGRMAAICDTYDWLVNDGAESAGLDPAAAIQQLSAMTGAFDPAVLASFVDTIGIHPVGAVVLLASGRLAMVVTQDEAEPMRPKVRTFWSANDCKLVPPTDIALANCFGEDQIVGTADPLAYGCADFPRLRERLFAGACTAG